MDELWDAFGEVLAARPSTSPWVHDADGVRRFEPDFDALASLISIPIEAGSESQTGRLAKSIDAWMANQLRRAGFDDDEVWPRLTKPRVLHSRILRSTSGDCPRTSGPQLKPVCSPTSPSRRRTHEFSDGRT